MSRCMMRGMKRDFKSFEFSQLKRPIGDFYTDALSAPPCINESSSFEEALAEFKSKRTSALCVVNGPRELIGVVTERDLLKYRFSESFDPGEKISSIMTSNPHYLDEQSDFMSALAFFKKFAIRTAPVVDGSKRPVLLMTTAEALKILTQNFHNELEGYGIIASINIMEVQAQEEDFSLSVYEQEKGRCLDSHLFLTPVRRVYSTSSARLDISSDLHETALMMIRKRVGTCVVVEYETHIQGVITERDFVTKVMGLTHSKIQKLKLKEVMTPKPRCILPRHNIAQALNTMFSVGCRQLVVVDEDQMPIGLLHLSDILSFFAQSFQKFEGQL